MTAFLAKIMSYIMTPFCAIFGNNFALAIFFFTVFINIVFCPINIKQQKSSAKQARLKNKIAKLNEKYADDRVKLQEETGKLYQEAGANPMSGCLLLLLRLPFFFGLYYAIQSPLTYLIHADSKLIDGAKKIAEGLKIITKNTRAPEIDILHNLDRIVAKGGEQYSALKGSFSFDLFGLDLTQTPEFSWNFSDWTWICIIPLLAFATAMLSSVVSMIIQKRTNPDAPSMNGMLLIMPLFSLWIAFSVPGAVGFYWACSSFIGMLIQVVTQLLFNPGRVIAKIEAKETLARRAKEQELIRAAADKN